jgi:uncharacterized small protein (DUF1192 family)
VVISGRQRRHVTTVTRIASLRDEIAQMKATRNLQDRP